MVQMCTLAEDMEILSGYTKDSEQNSQANSYRICLERTKARRLHIYLVSVEMTMLRRSLQYQPQPQRQR